MEFGTFIRPQIKFQITAILKWMAYHIHFRYVLKRRRVGTQGQEGPGDTVRENSEEMCNHIQFLRAYLSVLIISYFLKKVLCV